MSRATLTALSEDDDMLTYSSLSPALERAYVVGKTFTYRFPDKGVGMLVAPSDVLYRVLGEMDGELYERYKDRKGLLFGDDIFEMFYKMSRMHDGAFAFDEEGNLHGSDAWVPTPKIPELEEPLGRLSEKRGKRVSTRHRSGLTASYYGIPAVDVSESHRTVTLFIKGDYVRIYHPETGEEEHYRNGVLTGINHDPEMDKKRRFKL